MEAAIFGVLGLMGAWQIGVTFFVLRMRKNGNGHSNPGNLCHTASALQRQLEKVDERLTGAISGVDERLTSVVTRRNGELRDLRSTIEAAKKDGADSHRRLRQDLSNMMVDVGILKKAANAKE